jgi:CRISPR-associated protein Cas2
MPSRYQAMWLFVMFDLPVKTRLEKRRYVRFRKHLISEGFMALQYSVYARYFESEEASSACRRRVAGKVPECGRVRVLHVTERQFATMAVFFGKRPLAPEEPPEQLLLF